MSTPARTTVDPRAPRFGAAITAVVLGVALVLVGSPAAVLLVAWQLVVFGLGAFVGLQAQPYGWLYRTLVRPRLAPPAGLEDAAPPRFAQAVGFGFAAVALLALLGGVTVLGTVAIAFALAAAFLNAVFDFCLGCQMYLLGKRITARA